MRIGPRTAAIQDSPDELRARTALQAKSTTEIPTLSESVSAFRHSETGTVRGTQSKQVARFLAPRYLSCYIDILRQNLVNVERGDLVDQVPDVNVWLEFGASQQTQLSMMGLGLSRTTAIALSEFIVDDKLTEAEVLLRISALSVESLGLPLAIQREVKALIGDSGPKDAT